jgi:hypothetical protein
MDPAATRGTARNVNAPVEIAGFDFSGTARYRTVSERYLMPGAHLLGRTCRRRRRLGRRRATA